MKKLQKIAMILLMGLTSHNLIGQNGIGDSYKEVLKNVYDNTYYSNTILSKDLIKTTYVGDSNYISVDSRYFKNDTCYKYTSKSDIKYFDREYKTILSVYPNPLTINVWTSNIENDGIVLDWFTIIILTKSKTESIITITGYTDYNEYFEILSKIIKENNNE